MGARALPILLVPALLGALAAGCHKQAATAPQPEAPVTSAGPVAEAAPAAPDKGNAGKASPKATFTDLAANKPTDFAAFKGKPLLVNLWATWCVPCVKELPSLDRLAADQAGKLQVVAISEDMEGAKVVPPFLAAHGVKTLHAYHDPNNALLTELKEASLPVSILYDADGKEVWRLARDADWQGAPAKGWLGL